MGPSQSSSPGVPEAIRMHAIALAVRTLAGATGRVPDLSRAGDRDRLWSTLVASGLVGERASVDRESGVVHVYGAEDYSLFIRDCILLAYHMLRKKKGRVSIKDVARLTNQNYRRVIGHFREWVKRNGIDIARLKDIHSGSYDVPEEFLREFLDLIFTERYVEVREVNGQLVEHVIEGWRVALVRKNGKEVWSGEELKAEEPPTEQDPNPLD